MPENGWIDVTPAHPMFQRAKVLQKTLLDGFLNLVIERRAPGRDGPEFPMGRWHLSISHNQYQLESGPNKPGRMPTWDEIKEARYLFLPDDVNMAIMFPPKSKYYNLHDTCLHLLEVPGTLALDPAKQGGI